MCDLRKGDIVNNTYAGENNPTRYLLYIKKGTCRQGRYTHKVYDCIDYEGQKTQIMRDPDGLVKVGHMEEFDAFMAALRALKDRKDDEDD